MILRCPFCRKTSEDKDPDTLLPAVVATCYEPTKAHVVQCNNCGLSGPIMADTQSAISAWRMITCAI